MKLISSDGKKYETDCANAKTLFRIIQSIPSPKVELFKRWLAKVSYERVQKMEDPELATKRTRALYQTRGYPEGWIEKRMRGIVIREKNRRGCRKKLELESGRKGGTKQNFLPQNRPERLKSMAK